METDPIIRRVLGRPPFKKAAFGTGGYKAVDVDELLNEVVQQVRDGIDPEQIAGSIRGARFRGGSSFKAGYDPRSVDKFLNLIERMLLD